MHVKNIVSPGRLSNGISLRAELAKAVSAVEIVGNRVGGKTDLAYTLTNCLQSAIDAIADYLDVTASDFDDWAQTVVSASKITIAPDEAMDMTVTPSKTAFAVAGPGVISSVEWDIPNKLFVVKGTSLTAKTVTYTQPVSNKLRDTSGNLVLSS